MLPVLRGPRRRLSLKRRRRWHCSLKVVLVDVLLREHDWRAEQDLVFGEHLDLTETTGLEGTRAGQLVVDLGVGYVHREVAEIHRVPEDELLHGSGLEIRLHLVRGGESGDGHFARAAHLLDGLGGAGQGHGGYAEDSGGVGVGPQVVLGYVDTELEVLLAGLD